MLRRRGVSQLQPKKAARRPKESSILSPDTTSSGKNNGQPEVNGWAVAAQFLDTGWRVALPIIGLSYLGIRLDRHFGTRPLYAISGLFLSLGLASLLIYRQIKSAYPEFFKKNRGNK